jgi:hypothetical protein
MRTRKALRSWISLITVIILLSACNQLTSQDPISTNTPLPSVTAPATTQFPVPLTSIPTNLSLEEELAEIGKRQRETLSASTAFNAPLEIQVRDETKIQLLVSYKLPEEQLGQQVTEPGIVSTSRVEITPSMMAELTSPDREAFTIVPITQTEQLVGDTETTEWLWYVTANKLGQQTLTIVLSRGVKYDNQVQWIKVDTYERSIHVKGSLLDSLQATGWVWIAGILLLALAATPLLQRLGRSQRRNGESRKSPGLSSMHRLGREATGHIFISYRRGDSADIAGRIYDRLVDEYGRIPIFKDVDSIPLGSDFKEYLDQKVGECNALLAVIGDRWTDASDASGKRRLDDPADFVRVEIESALERGIPVIPLLVRGVQMPAEESLPPTLRKLTHKNGLQIRPDPDFHRDMDRLISALDQYIGAPQRE